MGHVTGSMTREETDSMSLRLVPDDGTKATVRSGESVYAAIDELVCRLLPDVSPNDPWYGTLRRLRLNTKTAAVIRPAGVEPGPPLTGPEVMAAIGKLMDELMPDVSYDDPYCGVLEGLHAYAKIPR